MTYHSCPLCNSTDVHLSLSAKDYTVSGEIFEIFSCGNCSACFTQNVPPQNEIGRYYQSENYISHSDTSEGVINRLYHTVRKRTLKKKLALLQNTIGTTKGSVLDIGSGTGAFLYTMKQAGWEVAGIEPDPLARENSLKLHRIEALSPEVTSGIQEHSFDAITMWHVLEHVHGLHEQMEQLKFFLKPQGSIFIAVPNFTSYDAGHYKQYWAAWDVPRHLYHFSPGGMKMLAEKHGFRIVGTKPMWYDSFYVSMLSEKYKTGKSNIAGAIMTGLISNLKAAFNNKKCSSIIYILQNE